MSHISVDTSLCQRDGACVAVCSSKVLARNEEGFPEEVAEENCILCGHCVAMCSSGALTHADLPQADFLAAVKELQPPALIDSFLMSRRSVREFKDQPVARETVKELLDVARRAPTANNSQKLHWIVVDDKAKVHALSRKVMDWMRTSGSSNVMSWMRTSGSIPEILAQWESGYDHVLRGASTVVLACAPEDYGWGKEDCVIALTYLELAAEARGLGVCWAGILTRIASVHAPLRQALLVPEGYAVYGGLMLGERKYKYGRIPPRKPLSVHWI